MREERVHLMVKHVHSKIARYLDTINNKYRREQCIVPQEKTTPAIGSSQFQLLFRLVHNINR